jgi:hypothetical protein
MRTQKEKQVAILTGDIIRSSRLDPAVQRRIPGTIRASAREAQKAFGKEAIPYVADIFRGDSWQLAVMDPALGTRVGLFLRAHLLGLPPERRLDSRVAVGLGPVTRIPHGSISEGTGRAFELSGKTSDTMPKRRRIANCRKDGLYLKRVVVCALMDSRSRTWTSLQGRAVAYAAGLSQEEIAARWTGGITAAGCGKHSRPPAGTACAKGWTSSSGSFR